MRKNNHVYYIRVNDEDYNLINQKIAESGRSINTYITQSAKDGIITSKEEINQLIELNRNFSYYNRQINAIGNNINQIAIKCNTLNQPISEREINHINQNILQMKRGADELWLSIRSQIMEERAGQQCGM